MKSKKWYSDAMDTPPMDPSVQSQPSVPTPTPTPAPPKRMSLWPVLVIALVAAYVAYASYNGLWPFTTGSEVTVSPTPTASVDPTAGWKTYTNTEYGYSFKYPSDWTIIKNGQNDMTMYATQQIFLRSPETIQGVQAKTINPGYSYDFVISFFKDGSAWAGDAGPSGPTYMGSTITVGGQVAKEYMKGGQGQNYAVVIDNFPPLWELSFETVWDKTKLTDEQRQILSTFKFTDTTAEWKTYTSGKEPGLSFKYPATWTLENSGNATYESIQLKGPKVGQYWTIINWSPLVDGLGGGCPPERPNIVINEVESLANSYGLYFVSFGEKGVSGKDNMGVVEVDANRNAPKLGDTGSCLYYPLFTSKIDASRKMWLTASNVQSQDRAVAKQILESLTY